MVVIFVSVERFLKGNGDNETAFRLRPVVRSVLTDDNMPIIMPQHNW
jgi:hypothetical protein